MTDNFHDNELATVLSNQEDILQFSRNLHYVFQGVFLGINFSLVAIGFAVLMEVTDNAKNRISLDVYGTALVSVLIIALFLRIIGLRLLEEYAIKILTRGIVIDTLQHMRILLFDERLSDLLQKIIRPQRNKPGMFFAVVKDLERLACSHHIINENIGVSCSDRQRWYSALNFYLETFVLNYNTRKNKLLALVVEPRTLFLIMFCNDIYSSNYLSSFPKRWMFRDIAEARKGHYMLFKSIWNANAILLIVLIGLSIIVSIRLLWR